MNDIDDDQLTLATTQIENEHAKATTTIMKKSQAQNINPVQHTFQIVILDQLVH